MPCEPEKFFRADAGERLNRKTCRNMRRNRLQSLSPTEPLISRFENTGRGSSVTDRMAHRDRLFLRPRRGLHGAPLRAAG
jgi:hypothetical protein